ncbi:MAG: hypothetical protein IPK23_09330 [Rhizobiales bacterium]|nr:hypothetical protein [Hyphomicrobiales bacterium]
MGLPRGLSGGFAITYAMLSGNSKVAVRCFKYEVPSRERAYKLIAAKLREIDSPYFVGFDYQAQGLKYNGDHLPCLKMEWVEGETLSVYLRRRGNDAATFHDLREKFAALAEHLEATASPMVIFRPTTSS